MESSREGSAWIPQLRDRGSPSSAGAQSYGTGRRRSRRLGSRRKQIGDLLRMARLMVERPVRSAMVRLEVRPVVLRMGWRPHGNAGRGPHYEPSDQISWLLTCCRDE